jgi:hypothetical protein
MRATPDEMRVSSERAPSIELDNTTKLDNTCRTSAIGRPSASHYTVVIYPEACEATIQRVRPARSFVPPRPSLEPRRSSRAPQARAHLRRYVVANGCNLHVTATFATSPTSRVEVHEAFRRAVRFLQRSLPTRFPYVAVCEDGGRKRRLHMHVLLPAEPANMLTVWWRRRFGWTTSTLLVDADAMRAAASYVAKDFDSGRSGNHRYWSAVGFLPRALIAGVPDLVAARELVRQASDSSPVLMFLSGHWRDTLEPGVEAWRWGVRSLGAVSGAARRPEQPAELCGQRAHNRVELVYAS